MDIQQHDNTSDGMTVGYSFEFPGDTPEHIKEQLEAGKFLEVDGNFFNEDINDGNSTFDNPPAGLTDQLVEDQRRKRREQGDI